MDSTELNDTEDRAASEELPPVRQSAVVRWLLGVLTVCVVVPSVLGFAGRYGWQIDLLNHFRFQYALLLLATTIGLALLRSRRMVWLSLAGLAANLYLVMPLYFGDVPSRAVDEAGPTLVIMHRNVNTGGGNPAAVAKAIRESGADLVFLQEVNPRWLGELEGNLGPYELLASEPRTDNFGIAGFVRRGDADHTSHPHPEIRIDSVRVFDITGGAADVPVIEVRARIDGRPLSLLSIHPLPPVNLQYAQARDAALAAATDWANDQPDTHLIVGDFNATPWSTAFRSLQRNASLVNSQAGYGRSATWPSGLATLGMIPIDHLLHSDDLVTVDRSLGEACGSDHLPLSVTLRWASP